MKTKRYYTQLSAIYFCSLLYTSFVGFVICSSDINMDLLIFLAVLAGVVLVVIGLMLLAFPGLFTDTVYIDEEKLIFETKKFKKTFYWSEIETVRVVYNPRGGKIYYIIDFLHSYKELGDFNFTCSEKFYRYMKKVYLKALDKHEIEYREKETDC